MRINKSNFYVMTSPYMVFKQYERHPSGGMSNEIETIQARVILLLSCVPRDETNPTIYDCQVVTGSFYRGDQLYRMSNYSLPTKEILAKERVYTPRQLLNMSDAERVAIQHELIVTKGIHNQIEEGTTLKQVMSMSSQAKRLLVGQFTAPEYYLDEPVEEEPDE